MATFTNSGLNHSNTLFHRDQAMLEKLSNMIDANEKNTVSHYFESNKINGKQPSHKLVRVTTLQVVDEFAIGRSRDNNHKSKTAVIPTRKSFTRVTALDVETYGHETQPTNFDTQGAGNLKHDNPMRFKKDDTLNKGTSFLRRISDHFTGKSRKVAPLALEYESPSKQSTKASRSTVFNSRGSVFAYMDPKNAALINNFGILYKDFKQDKRRYAYYMLYDVCRNILLAILLVFFQSYPYEQAVAISSINTLMLLYLIIMRPFNKTKDAVLNTFNEFMVAICCYACLYIAYLERNEDFDTEKRLNAGWVIYYVNMLLMMFFTLVFIVDLLFTIKEIVPKVINLIKKRIERVKEKKRIAALTKSTVSDKPGLKPIIRNPQSPTNKKEHFNKLRQLVEGQDN
jgi:hypothetical protein